MIWDKLHDHDWSKVAPYVDTLLIPVININLEDKAKFDEQRTDSLYAAAEIERQLTGRVILMPPVSYITNDAAIQSYVTSIRRRAQNSGFGHLFFLIEGALIEETEDIDWGDYLEVPPMPSSSAEASNEIRKLCEQIIQIWQKEV